jgi:hypothetical protein
VYVTAIHQITDPEKFPPAVRAATSPASEFPAGIVLHSTFSNPDDTMSVCLWEAESVDAVRDLVDSAVGQFSQNEYFEVSKETALGLPD